MGSLFSLCALAWLYSTVRSSLLARGGIAFANTPRLTPANAGKAKHSPASQGSSPLTQGRRRIRQSSKAHPR